MAVVASIGAATAKTPGESHCYRDVCHRVKTIAETASLVGRTLGVTASHYDTPGNDRYNTGIYTSSGVMFNADDPTATSSSNFPDGTELLVWNPSNGHAAHVRVVDFGPFLGNRTLDLTRAAAEELGFAQQGIAKLRVTIIAPPPDDEPRYRLNRFYRKVGGFIGVYRRAELSSLTSLLVYQARRRRQPQGFIRAALSISTPATVINASRARQSTSALNSAVSRLSKHDMRREGDANVVSKNTKSARERYLTAAAPSSAVVTQSVPKGRYVMVAARYGSQSVPATRTLGVTSNATARARSDVTRSGRGIEGTRGPRLNIERTFATNRLDGIRDRTGDLVATKTARLNVRSKKTVTSVTSLDPDFNWVFVFSVLVLATSTFMVAYITVPTSSAPVFEFHRIRAGPYRLDVVEPAEVEIVEARRGASAGVTNTHPLSAHTPGRQSTGGTNSPAEPIAEDGVPDATSTETTHIKAGTKVLGSISDVGAIKISGRIEGDCVCDRVTIAPGGVVTGHVTAKWALIEGEVEGEVEVTDIRIKSGARLKGDVRYHNLELENGAVLEAACTRIAAEAVSA